MITIGENAFRDNLFEHHKENLSSLIAVSADALNELRPLLLASGFREASTIIESKK